MSILRVCKEISSSHLRSVTVLLLSGLVLSSVSTALLPTAALASPRRSHSAPRLKTVRSATVRVSTAFLRLAPGEHNGSRALLDKGHAAQVVGEKGEWLRLRLASGTEGWVRADLLSVKEKSFRLPQPAKKIAKVATARAKRSRVMKTKKPLLASAPRRSTTIVKIAKTAAATLPPVNRAARFNRAAYAQSARIALRTPLAEPKTTAPLAADDMRPAALPIRALIATSTAPAEARRIDDEPEAPAVPVTRAAREVVRDVVTETHAASYAGMARGLSRVRTALGYRGAAYISGATGRGGFDCSGFMVFLLAREGKSLPRTAAEQFHAGTKVERGSLRPGDLVFFKNTYKAGISHVGLYTGNGQFIHAANRRLGVKVDALSSSYYANHWAGARRPR